MQSKQDNIDLILNDIKSNLAKDDGFSHANLEFTIASGDDDTVDIESKADSDKNPEIKNDSNKPTQDNKAAVADKKILTESSAKNQKESEKKEVRE